MFSLPTSNPSNLPLILLALTISVAAIPSPQQIERGIGLARPRTATHRHPPLGMVLLSL